jgi:excisionase family DNA binding protein
MSPDVASWQGGGEGGSASQGVAIVDDAGRPTLSAVGSISTVSTQRGAPVVRNLVRLLKVREVAELLSVCTATVYAMVRRGELEAVWVGASLRFSEAVVETFVPRHSGPQNSQND